MPPLQPLLEPPLLLAWKNSGPVLVALLLLAGLAFAGCANVPDTKFLKHRSGTQRAEFKNAWGPVSARASTAIMKDLKGKSDDVGLVDRQVALEQAITGSPLVLGNKVTLLQDGPATYQAMFGAMRAAKHTINVESYIIQDDEIGQEFAAILRERRAAGVKINVLYDGVGAFLTDKAYFEKLRQAGVQVLEFNPPNPLAARSGWKLTHRDHRKLTIVDGRTVFLGGINIDSVYSSSPLGVRRAGSSSGGFSMSGGKQKNPKDGGWRDTDIQIDGPVVADFQKLFLQSWEKQKGPALNAADYLPQIAPQGKEIVRAIGSGPEDRYSAIYLTLIAAITYSEKQVYITNAYFVPDPQLIEALTDAAKRGVDVRLILPSVTDSKSAAIAAHRHYEELLAGGVKIYERQAALLHAKTAVVDGVWSCVGSANLDWLSAVANDEVNAVILSREFAQQMLKAYALDQAQSDEINLAQWKARPWRERCKEWLVGRVSRLL